MGFFYYLLILSTIIFPLMAYFSTQRKHFLILNSIAIFVIGINFYIHNGHIGLISEILMLITHLIALFCKYQYVDRLKLFLPVISFLALVFLFNNAIINSYLDIFMPLSIAMFSYGALEKSMLNNKIAFTFGLLFLFLYSFGIDAIYVMLSSFLGILLNLYTYNKILLQNKKFH